MSHLHLLPTAPAASASPAAPTDTELVSAARSGDKQAQGELFRRHAQVVYGLAFRLIGPNDARDVMQDAFVQALRSLQKLDEPGFFRSWLCGITVRIVRHRLRRMRLFRAAFSPDRIEDVADYIDPAAPPDVQAELKWAYARLSVLPERPRVAFILRRMEGMTGEEVALAMGLSLTTVKRLVLDAEQRLEKPARRPYLKGLT